MFQTVLDLLQLPVSTAQHGHFRKSPMNSPVFLLVMGFQHIHAARHALDLLGDKHALGKGIVRLHQPNGRAARNVGVQLPGRAGISVNDGQSRFQHRGHGAVVFLQTDETQPRVTFPQAVEAVRVCAAEAVNGLIRVADDEQAALPPVLHQLVLQGVDVLKLVHQQVAEAGFPAHVQRQCFRQQVVQISCAQFVHPFVVGFPQAMGETYNFHAVLLL